MGGGKHPPKTGVARTSASVQLLGAAARDAVTGKGATSKPQGKEPVVSAAPAQPAPTTEPAPAEGELKPLAASAETAPVETNAPPALPPDADPVLAAAPERKLRYDCRKCRAALFTTDEVVPHSDDSGARGHKAFSGKNYHTAQIMQACSSLFLDPEVTAWVSDQANAGGNAGDLVCPTSKCGARIGSWSWIGSQCSCGQWVNPSFKVVASKLDAFPVDDGVLPEPRVAGGVAVPAAAAATA
eukprot:CAMPEP_0174840466 /NCGR_PEP_ID=MMETSP1114-20130205/8696_1 /TAXON_ID=312471 /ORGANISM="Neobodo designis, Strain CCAP 1951/1" /LENGTH=241 /DNA_ID=CAMNT_0016074613 /DNA_START=44 /DNA_END=769 /DNA_ORIENTATION=+